MNTSSHNLCPGVLILCSFLIGGFPTLLLADHAWGSYHWERESNPISLTLGANITSEWSYSLNFAISDWDSSSVLSLSRVSGGTTAKRCKPATGTIEVCNDTYGNNGWLGVAGISVSGNHIIKAYTKLNDSYFNTQKYNTSAWRALVMCQEIGHDFGLGHQDENFNNTNLDTCMDYTSDPESNQHPNPHDYEKLRDIYSHLDGNEGSSGGECFPQNSRQCRNRSTPPPAMDDIDLAGPGQWGRLVGRSADGHQEMYELDFGHGYKVLTHVTWVESKGPGLKRTDNPSDH